MDRKRSLCSYEEDQRDQLEAQAGPGRIHVGIDQTMRTDIFHTLRACRGLSRCTLFDKKNEAMRSSAGLTYLRFLPRAFTWRGSNRKASLQQIQQSPAVPEEFVSRFHFLAATNQFKFLPQLGNLPSASRHQEPCPAHNRSTGQER